MEQSTHEVIEEIKEMKRLLIRVLEEEHAIEKKEDAIEQEEERIEKQQNKLLGGLSALKYANIQAWKTMIWDGCGERVSGSSDGKEIDYLCKLLNGPCRFEECPKNKSK